MDLTEKKDVSGINTDVNIVSMRNWESPVKVLELNTYFLISIIELKEESYNL